MVLGPGSGSMNDTDLSLSVRRRGCRLIYDPACQVDHYPAQRHGVTHRDQANPQQVFLDSHNWAYLSCKHFPAGQRAVGLAYALLVGSGNRWGLGKFLWAAVRGSRQAGRHYLATCHGLHAGRRDWKAAHRAPGGLKP